MTTNTSTLREQICQATDTLNEIRRRYYQQQATYEEAAAAATTLLELRRQAEQQFKGRSSIKINPVSIARLLRST